MRHIESLGCHVEGETVYVYDQDGNTIDTFLLNPYAENVYSSGRSIIVETPSDIQIYSLRDGHMEHTGSKLKPPKFDMEVENETTSSSNDEYCPEPPSSGSGIGYWGKIAIAIGLIWFFFFSDNKKDNTQHTGSQVVSTTSVSRYSGVRKYIKEFIDEQGGCRIAAITKNGGNVAVAGENSCAVCGAYPNKLWDALKEINDARHRITDVCLTDAGSYVVLFGRNGYRSNGLPKRMLDFLAEFNNNNEELYCATLNDAGDWVVISDKHYIASSTELMDWLNDGQRKHGALQYVAITDDARMAVFEYGFRAAGNYPKGLLERIRKADFNLRIIKMAGDSWFFADETGRFDYHM